MPLSKTVISFITVLSKLHKPPHSLALGSYSLYLEQNHSNSRELVKTNTTVNSNKRIQTTEREEDCPWKWRDGQIYICTMLIISLL